LIGSGVRRSLILGYLINSKSKVYNMRYQIHFAAMTSALGITPARLADLDTDTARWLLPPRRSEPGIRVT
jgi:hypothetical protein